MTKLSTCNDENCDKSCESRHPKPYKFRSECRFLKKKWCAFKHDALGHKAENKDEKIKELEQSVANLKSESESKNKIFCKVWKDLDRNLLTISKS